MFGNGVGECIYEILAFLVFTGLYPLLEAQAEWRWI
jgi:hypothetical protein